VSETSSELGGALGIAVLGSIGAAVYRRQVADAVPAGVSPEAAATARDTLGGAVGVAGQLSEGLGEALLAASRTAYIDGLHLVAACGAVILIGVAVLAALWLPRRQLGPESEAPSDVATPAACAVV
jgi:DHA2 family multidrug resistance protein-like MFS transporter